MDKTTRYILMIVGMVAVVAVVSIFTRPGIDAGTDYTDNGNLMTGNVVSEEVSQTSFLGFTKFLVSAMLVWGCVYIYRQY